MIRFSVLNRCIYPLKGGSDCRSRCLQVEIYNCQIRDVLACALGTSRDTGKRTRPSDSARQIGLSTPSRDVLIVDQGVCR